MANGLLLLFPLLLLLTAFLAALAIRQATLKKLRRDAPETRELVSFMALMEAQTRLAAVPGTEIAVPGTDIAVPGTDIAVPGTDIAVPKDAAGMEQALACERIFAVILGSQLELLQFLLSQKVRAANVSEAALRPYHDEFVRRCRVRDYPLAAWLRLPLGGGLIAARGPGYAITPRGEAFLRYVLQRYPGLVRTRPF